MDKSNKCLFKKTLQNGSLLREKLRKSLAVLPLGNLTPKMKGYQSTFVPLLLALWAVVPKLRSSRQNPHILLFLGFPRFTGLGCLGCVCVLWIAQSLELQKGPRKKRRLRLLLVILRKRHQWAQLGGVEEEPFTLWKV